jgi:hypothetical protein
MAEDRLARLNALASGGTAGLKAFDDAQASTLSNRQNALDRTLSVKTAGGRSAAADSALTDVVNRYTQGYVNDAGSARANAGDQVGYDSSALDSFLANQQKSLDERRRQAMQGMDLDQTQFQAQQGAAGRKLDLLNWKTAQAAQGPGFADLDQGEQDALVGGRAQELQDQDKETAQKEDAANAYALAAGWENAKLAEQRSTQPVAEGEFRSAETAKAQVDEAARLKAESEAALAAFNRAADARKSSADLAALAADLPSGSSAYGTQWAQDAIGIMNNRRLYEQAAAEEFGMDPYMARGRYEDTPEARQKALNDLVSGATYDPATALAQGLAGADEASMDVQIQQALRGENLSPEAVASAAQSVGVDPQTGAAWASRRIDGQDQSVASQVNALANRAAQGGELEDGTKIGDAAEDKFVWFSNALDELDGLGDLSPQEREMWKRYYRNLFFSSPTANQQFNAEAP